MNPPEETKAGKTSDKDAAKSNLDDKNIDFAAKFQNQIERGTKGSEEKFDVGQGNLGSKLLVADRFGSLGTWVYAPRRVGSDYQGGC